MKKEDLFESIGKLDEELIRSSERSVRRYTWSKRGGIAACLVLAFGVAAYMGKALRGTERPEMAVGYDRDIYVAENVSSQVEENEEWENVNKFEQEENEAGEEIQIGDGDSRKQSDEDQSGNGDSRKQGKGDQSGEAESLKQGDEDQSGEADSLKQGSEEQNGENDSLNNGSNTQPAAGSPQSAEKKFVDIGTLLASNGGSNGNIGAIQEQALRIGTVPVGQYTALYTNEEAADSTVLGASLGEQITGAKDFYKVSGHVDLQYLIRKEQDGYTLWKFQSFQSIEYPYSDVLQLIYDIDSAKDLLQIVVEPATMDNSDAGKAIQKEIGTLTVSDNEEIAEIYEILSAMTCYGSDHWDLIGIGGDTPEAMKEKMELGRYLTIETNAGNRIDGLKYTGVSDMFYEYSGIAYGKLEEEQKEIVETIFKIEGLE